MMNLRTITLTGFTCFLCVLAHAQQQSLIQCEAEKKILRLHEVYEKAVANKDLNTILGLYEEEAVYLPFQHVILKGKEEIKKAWQRTFNIDLARFDLELISVVSQGDFLFEVGRTHAIFKLPEGEMPGEFKFLNVWRRQPNGQYKIFRATYNQWVAPIESNN